MPTLTKTRVLHPSVYDAHVAAQRAYRVVHGATAVYPTATFVQDKSGDGTAVGMVKLKQLATAPMAQEKRISEQEGQQEGPDYLRSGWAAIPHQSHAQRRLEHKRLRNVRQPQQHFVASPMDKLMSPQTSIGKTRPIVYMSASVGTAIEAISPKRLRQRNVQSKTKTASRSAWPLPGKNAPKVVPRYQRKEEPFFRVGPLEKAGLAKESERCIEAPSPKRVKDRRRMAGDRPFTSTLPLQANSPLHAMHSVMVNDFANDFNLQSTSVPDTIPAFASHNGSCSTSIRRRNGIPTMRLTRENRCRKPQSTPLVRMLKGDYRLSYVKEIVASAKAHRGMDHI